MTQKFSTDEGWQELKAGGFTGATGPFFVRNRNGVLEVALAAEPRHCNSNMQTVHGGVVMTFADICLGRGAAEVIGGPNLVTVQLNVHFVAGSRAGDILIGRPEIVRQTSQLVFVRGLIEANGKTVANADGIWKAVAMPAAK